MYIPVKLAFVRNRNKTGKHIVLLTTHCNLSKSEVVRLYGNRWNTELFSGQENPCSVLAASYKGSATIYDNKQHRQYFYSIYTIQIAAQKNQCPKTICELFYVCCDDIQDMELCTTLSSWLLSLWKGS